MAVQPDIEDLKDYLGLTDSVYTDAELGEVLDAALEQQRDVCVWDLYEAPLFQAALRRAARLLAARGAPLGTLSLGDYGVTSLIRYDALIESLESSYRVGNFA